jgi:type VI secretion system protein ImpF
MSITTRKNRLSPPFMHAFQKRDLRDEAGDRVIAARRAAARTTISEPNLRREVARDLEALVNAVAMESTQGLAGYDAVRKSILNFGLPDLLHRSIDEAGVGDIEREIATALQNYEPRLVAGTLEVRRDASVDKEELKVRFFVRADLMCSPVNVPVEFIADVELDGGGVSVKRA